MSTGHEASPVVGGSQDVSNAILLRGAINIGVGGQDGVRDSDSIIGDWGSPLEAKTGGSVETLNHLQASWHVGSHTSNATEGS